MRRLPVFLVLDVSDSMVGEPRRLLEKGLETLIQLLRQDPHALETAYISVIAFAGKVETLVPLIDVISFYPPQLPLGSGTAMGLALDHLMTEIDQSVRRSSAERKGDWKPAVFFLTDGKPTDEMGKAAKRWKADYASKVNLIAIGLGPYADTDALGQFADEVIRYDGGTEEDFRKFIRWISASVSSMSVAVRDGGERKGLPVSLDKAEGVLKPAGSTVRVDEDVVVVVGKCQRTKRPYLLKYEPLSKVLGNEVLDSSIPEIYRDAYQATEGFAIDESYFDWSDSREVNASVEMNRLVGGVGCPQCGGTFSMTVCGCGGVFCTNGRGVQTCPWCGRSGKVSEATAETPSISVKRSSG
uniref:Uncharacterized conserved protein YegL, contains vWA domain of TerY type n=1 Tax=Candidatus Kentrum sp. FM TaxID=2126340 RepID=A0A450S9H9_9GAMM|nr:MAG: Uncharacterized conserved protein YegL, contains vWA domain of TerY type [Candidatus Kentron sp. FM]VFJ48674.1 MAG: Uncharacterized conserved protein YegL, contains vWA domain of TerY type [Candidatus Kentron sp. FM]VFK08171.1 MAG: Uncharacterized conserved protein YegL, contains vWA domain of TerY type [Candidatus Kentron sp. FM]